MTRTATRWIRTLAPQTAILATAAAAFIGLSTTTAHAAAAAPATTTPAAASAKTAPAAKSSAKQDTPAPNKSLKHNFQLQNTFYNCGPSATRVALSAHGKTFTQAQVGHMLGTTENGTDSANQVTDALNKQLGKGRYHTVEISGAKASKQQTQQLQSDVVTAINHGDPVVANIAGTVTDTNGDAHSYEGGHYIPIVGYNANGKTVTIADSADTEGSPYYDVTIDTMANWIATRGYSA